MGEVRLLFSERVFKAKKPQMADLRIFSATNRSRISLIIGCFNGIRLKLALRFSRKLQSIGFFRTKRYKV